MASGRRTIVSWALYDFANSAFATTVLAGFFPLFFRGYYAAGQPDGIITFRLGLANTLASLALALTAPFLGAMADRAGRRKRFLLVFTVAGAAATAALVGPGRGAAAPALLLFGAALFFWSAALAVYDALLRGLADGPRLDRVSALGYALGYLGGGLLFLVNVLMVRDPAAFGLADKAAAVKVSFAAVAAWWLLFAVPLFLFVPEPATRGPRVGLLAAAAQGGRQVLRTLRQVRRLKPVAVFLLAYWLYIDGVDTIIRMAVDHGRSLGLPEGSLISALLLTQFVGLPAAIAFGRLGERWGARKGIYLGLAVYALVCVWGAILSRPWEFYALAVAVGLVQGGVQSLSRSMFARIAPPARAAEFFGFYNMVGKYAAVLGPVLLGSVKLLTGSAAAGIASVLLLFGAGALLLSRVDEDAARSAAEAAAAD